MVADPVRDMALFIGSEQSLDRWRLALAGVRRDHGGQVPTGQASERCTEPPTSSSPASEKRTSSPAKVEVVPTRGSSTSNRPSTRPPRATARWRSAAHQVEGLRPGARPDDYEEHPDNHLDERRPLHNRTRGRDHHRDERPDGTSRRPSPIWLVRVGGGLDICSYRGPGGSWFRQAARHPYARVAVHRHGLAVHLVPTGATDRKDIDAAYTAKYGERASPKSTHHTKHRRHDTVARARRPALSTTTATQEHAMHTRTLGQGLQVSAIGLGAWACPRATAPTPATATT